MRSSILKIRFLLTTICCLLLQPDATCSSSYHPEPYLDLSHDPHGCLLPEYPGSFPSSNHVTPFHHFFEILLDDVASNTTTPASLNWAEGYLEGSRPFLLSAFSGEDRDLQNFFQNFALFKQNPRPLFKKALQSDLFWMIDMPYYPIDDAASLMHQSLPLLEEKIAQINLSEPDTIIGQEEALLSASELVSADFKTAYIQFHFLFNQFLRAPSEEKHTHLLATLHALRESL